MSWWRTFVSRDGRWTALVTAALLTTALAMIPVLRYGFERYTSPKDLLLGLAGAVAAIWFARELADRRVRLSGFEVALGFYFFAGVISAVLAGRIWTQGASWLALELSAVLMLYATRRAAAGEDARDRILDALVAAAAFVAVLAVFEALGVRWPWGGSRRPQSSLGSRNYVAAYAALALPLATARCLRSPHLLRAAAIAVLTAVVIFCRARSVWLAFLILVALLAAGAIYFRVRPSALGSGRRMAAAALLIGLVLGVAVPWRGLRWKERAPLSSSLSRLFEHERGSGKVRLDQHRLAVAIVGAHPVLGIGPRGWYDGAAQFAHVLPSNHALSWVVHPPTSPQSDLARVAAEQGLFGLLAALAAGLFLVRRLLRSSWQIEEVAIAGALLLALVNTALDSPLSRSPAALQISVLAGLAFGTAEESSIISVPRSIYRTILIVAALFVIVVPALNTAAVLNTYAGGYSPASLRLSQRIFPRVNEGQKLVQLLGTEPCGDGAAELKWLVRAAPHYWGPLVGLADCAERAGNLEQARQLLERAKEIEPHNDNIPRLLQRIDEKMR